MLIFTIILYSIIIIALCVLLGIMIKKHIKEIDITKVKDEETNKSRIIWVKK